MVKATELDATPPGLTTVTPAVPAAAVRAAGTTAVNCVPLKNVVTSDDPFQTTVDPVMNPDPFTVSVNADPPAMTEFGFKLPIVGIGELTVKLTELEVAPPRLTTFTAAVAGALIRLAATMPIN
jgi:hypothetical protein